jgi:hypothetical protein
MVTKAHRVKKEVCADGTLSATPYGAAAAAPPQGTFMLAIDTYKANNHIGFGAGLRVGESPGWQW